MITTAKITDINKNIGSFKNNAYELEIYILVNAGDTEQDIKSKRINATVCLPGGIYNPYDIGDYVYVGFIDNTINYPVILGKIYQGTEDIYKSGLKIKSLQVRDNVILSENTKFGETNFSDILKIMKDSENLNQKILQLEEKVKNLEQQIQELKE